MAACGARRNSRGSCRPSGFLARRRPPPRVNGPPLLSSGCASSAGLRVAPSRSSIVGQRDAASAPPKLLPSSSGLRSISLSRREPHKSPRQSRRHQSSRSCSRWRMNRWAAVLFQSLARPGGNVTGLSIQQTDVAGKRIELLRELVSGLRRLGILANVGNPGAALEMGEVQATARTLGLDALTLEIRRTGRDCARIRVLQGPSGGALPCWRPTHAYQSYSHQYSRTGRATAIYISPADIRRSGRFDVLWTGLHKPIPTRRRDRR